MSFVLVPCWTRFQGSGLVWRERTTSGWRMRRVRSVFRNRQLEVRQDASTPLTPPSSDNGNADSDVCWTRMVSLLPLELLDRL